MLKRMVGFLTVAGAFLLISTAPAMAATKSTVDSPLPIAMKETTVVEQIVVGRNGRIVSVKPEASTPLGVPTEVSTQFQGGAISTAPMSGSTPPNGSLATTNTINYDSGNAGISWAALNDNSGTNYYLNAAIGCEADVGYWSQVDWSWALYYNGTYEEGKSGSATPNASYWTHDFEAYAILQKGTYTLSATIWAYDETGDFLTSGWALGAPSVNYYY